MQNKELVDRLEGLGNEMIILGRLIGSSAERLRRTSPAEHVIGKNLLLEAAATSERVTSVLREAVEEAAKD